MRAYVSRTIKWIFLSKFSKKKIILLLYSSACRIVSWAHLKIQNKKKRIVKSLDELLLFFGFNVAMIMLFFFVFLFMILNYGHDKPEKLFQKKRKEIQFRTKKKFQFFSFLFKSIIFICIIFYIFFRSSFKFFLHPRP